MSQLAMLSPAERHLLLTEWGDNDAAKLDGDLAKLVSGAGETVANRVVDRHLQPVPSGVPGELCLSGASLGCGIPGRPDRTAERFLPDPYGADPGARLFCTLHRRQGLPFVRRPDPSLCWKGML